MNADINKKYNIFYIHLYCFIISLFLNINLDYCQINDNFTINTLEEGNYNLLDVTDNHNLNLIVSTSKNIYTGLPPTLKTTTTANLISVSSVISASSSHLLVACLQDSFLTKIRLSDGETINLLDYSQITSPSISVPEKICSLSIYDKTLFIGYTTINHYPTETNKTNIIFKITLTNLNSDNVGPKLDNGGNIQFFQFPETSILTDSIRQISCEPLKVTNNTSQYRLVCLHETKGYYTNNGVSKLEYFLYATSINENFDNFEKKMNEFQTAYSLDSDGQLGFRMYRINGTHARCLANNTFSGMYLIYDGNGKAKIVKEYTSNNLYKLTAEMDLTSFSNNIIFFANKVNFMNKDNVYSFRINRDSKNYLKIYDYKDNSILKILGYYSTDNDYMICIYQTEDKIKYFSMQNNQAIYNLESKSTNIQMKTYQHIEYEMSSLVTNIADLGTLNVETIYRNSIQNTYGIDYYELFMDNNLFIPEKSFNTQYKYNFSFIEHSENDYTRIYYISYINIEVSTCYSSTCSSCWEGYNTCDNCLSSSATLAATEDTSLCYPKDLIIKGYVYNSNQNKFKACYSTCDFCSKSSAESTSSTKYCESCKEGYLFSYSNPMNCFSLNDLEITEPKEVSDNKFISSTCSNYQIFSNGECVDSCPTSSPYYSFEYDTTTGGYTKTSLNPPKYLFNKKCYDACPSNTVADANNVCQWQYGFHTNINGEKACYSNYDCSSDYPYKNADTNQCFSSLSDCNYFFNNDCYDACPSGKIALNSKSEEIKDYFVAELIVDTASKDKLCICDTTNGVWKKINPNGSGENDIYFQECLNGLDLCPEGYVPESLTNQCVLKTETPTTIITTEPITTLITTEPITTILTTQPITTILTTEPITTITTTQPITTILTTEPITTITTTQPITTITTTEPISTIITTEPLSTIITTEPITTNKEIITTHIATITTEPITTQFSIYTSELTEESTITQQTPITTQIITTLIHEPSTSELSISTTEPINELKIMTTTPSTAIYENNIIVPPTTEPHFNERIPTTYPINIEEETYKNEYPEEFNKDPDNCLVIYKDKCYKECPEGTCINQNDPSLMFCIQIKGNVRVFNGICFTEIDNMAKNIKSISENNEIVSTDTGIIIRGYSSKSENNDILSETKYSQIELGDCEKKIKEYYYLPEETELFILGIDSPNKNKNSSASVYNYEIYLENGTKLDYSTACKDTKISISSVITNPDLVNLDEGNYFNDLGYDIYQENSTFYTDNCAPASIDGNDVTLSDRKKHYFPSNVSLCNESCSYVSTNFTTKRFTCECNNSYDFSDNENIDENEEEEEDISYLEYFLSLINYKIIVCYNLFFDFKSYYYNAGFYIAVGNFVLCLILIFVFVKYGLRSMNELILESTPNKHKLLEALKEQNERRKDLIKMELLNNKNPPKKRKTWKKKHVKEVVESTGKLININDENKKGDMNINDKNINQNKGNENIDLNRNNKKKKTFLMKSKIRPSIVQVNILMHKKSQSKTNIPKIKKGKSSRRKSSKKIISKKNNQSEFMKNEKKRLSANNISLSTEHHTENQNSLFENRQHDLIKLMDDERVNKKELNTIPYTQALRIDRRGFLEILLSVLAHEIGIIDIFYYKSMFTHLSITLSIYIFELCLDLTLNCLLYTDDVVSEKYNNNGSIGFFTTLSLSFMSNIFASIFAYFVSQLAEYGSVLELMLKDVVIKKQYFLNMIKFKRYITLKLGAFFIIQAIINLGMCYYLMIFCTVYHKTQVSIMINYIVGIAESMAISVGLTIITSIIRYISLKNRSKSLYYTSKYLFDKF